MASPSIRAAAEAAQTSNTATSITITKPTGTVEDDVMYAVISLAESGSSAPALSGWTEIETTTDGSLRLTLLRKVAGASEGSDYTFTWTGGSRGAGGIVSVQDADTTTPEAAEGTPATGNSTTPDPPNADPGSSGDYLALAMFGQEDKAMTATPSSGYTEWIEVGPTGGGGGTAWSNVYLCALEYTGQAQNPGTMTSSEDDPWIAYTVIVAPAAGGDATATPTTVAAAGTLTAPTLTADSLHVATTVANPGSLTAPTVVADANATTTTIDAAASLTAPTITLSATVVAVTVDATAELPTPTVTAGSLTTPALIGIPPDIPAPTIDIGVTATPATVEAAGSLTAPTVTADALTATSTTIDVPPDVPQPTVTVSGGDADATPVTVEAVGSLATPTVVADALTTPTTVDVPPDVPAPSLTADAVATPTTVEAPTSLTAPTIVADALTATTTITVPFDGPTPTVTASATVTPATVEAPASLETPGISVYVLTVYPATVQPWPKSFNSAFSTAFDISAEPVVLTPTVVAHATVTPSTITVPFDVPAPTQGAAYVVDVSTVELTVEVPTPTVTTGGGATATPVTITVQSWALDVKVFTTGVVAPDPLNGRVNGYDKAILYRRVTGAQAPMLMFMPVGRGQQVGIHLQDEQVSDVFVYTTGTRDQIQEMLVDEWATDKASSNAVLRAVLNARLDELGFKGPNGVSLI